MNYNDRTCYVDLSYFCLEA